MKWDTESAIIDSGYNGSIIIHRYETIWDRQNLRLKPDASTVAF